MQMGRSGVVKLAVKSRAVLLGLIVLWRVLGRPYDTSALLNPPCLGQQQTPEKPLLLPEVGRVIERLIVWDGVYYIRIAECGYEYEQTFAFLPVFPLSVRFIANTVLSGAIRVVGYRATLALSGLLLNNVAFILSAICMYKVSIMVLKNEVLAYQATALFCCNPASIFYVSIYSESFFSLFSFSGMWAYLHGSRWMSACLFAISGGVRSNGVVHGGFLLFNAMQDCLKALHQHRIKRAVRIVCMVILQTAIVLAPFAVYQTFGYLTFCSGREDLDRRPWCNARVPYMYGFVQSHYWDVGFLRYFQVKQLPNFLLASPILSLAVLSLSTYVKCQPHLFFTLGLGVNSSISPSCRLEEEQPQYKIRRSQLTASKGFVLRRRGQNHAEMDDVTINTATCDWGGYLSPLAIPFLIEMAFMALIACVVMHVQVATRFLSICAPIYWYAAQHILSSPSKQKVAHILWATFYFYIALGSLLFVNFYPFT